MHYSQVFLILVLSTLTTQLWAYEAGDIILRAGIAEVSPDASSSELNLNDSAINGSSANVHNDTQLGLTGVYMLNSRWGVELLASTPFEHNITADTGALALGRINAGSGKHLPPTLSIQYFPAEANSQFQPYVGAGINYTLFFSENISPELESVLGAGTLKLDNSLGLSLQAGLDYQISDQLLVNFSVWYMDIDTDATFNFVSGDRLTTDVSIDPTTYMLSLGYKF